MNPVVQFLTENPIVYLATCDKDHHPRVRPFQFMLEHDGKLYFCSSKQKKVYKEMKYNPSIELSSSSPESVWIRIRGRVNFADNPELKKRILDENPLVQSIYKTPDNPDFVIFYLADGSAVIEDLSGSPPKTFAI